VKRREEATARACEPGEEGRAEESCRRLQDMPRGAQGASIFTKKINEDFRENTRAKDDTRC
jgi:hypothetical protein